MSKKAIHEFNAAVDGGNHSIKVGIDGKYDRFLNVFVEAEGNKNVQAILKREGLYPREDCNLYDSLYVNFKLESEKVGTEFMFEERATTIKGYKHRENSPKNNDKQLIKNMILSIVVHKLSQLEKDSYEEEMNLKVNISTGLPVKEYDTQGCKANFENLIKGNHTITLLDEYYTSTLGIKKINVEVAGVHVQMEGLASLQLINKFSSIPSEKAHLLDGKELEIIDIGQHTTDYAGASLYISDRDDKLRLTSNEQLTAGFEKGIGDSMEDVIHSIVHSGKIDAHSPVTVNDILRAATKFDYKINKYNLNIKEMYKAETEALGKEIAERFVNMCNLNGSRQRLMQIVLSGGGSKDDFVVEAFKEYLRNNGFDDKIVTVIKKFNDPIYANVAGYTKMSKFNN